VCKPLWKPDGATFGDCAFIAHAREDIPALLAYVEELEAAIREHCHYFCVLSGEDGPCIEEAECPLYPYRGEE
jgi:hypothetical protein